MDTIKQYQEYSQDAALHIFSTIFFTQGFARTLIFDSQYRKVLFAPSTFYAFVKQYRDHSLQEICRDFEKNKHPILSKYISFIIDNKLGLFLSKKYLPHFSEYNSEYASPYHFENAILCFANIEHEIFRSRVDTIDSIGVPHIELRFLLDDYDANQMVDALNYLEENLFQLSV